MVASTRHFFPDVELIAGIETAGISWGTLLAETLGLPMAYVRSEKKSHGSRTLVEAGSMKGRRVLIIDDLVASGSSIAAAAAALQTEIGAVPIGVQSIVNWGFSHMREAVCPMRFHALTSYRQILARALLDNVIDRGEFNQLTMFYEDPTSYKWTALAHQEGTES